MGAPRPVIVSPCQRIICVYPAHTLNAGAHETEIADIPVRLRLALALLCVLGLGFGFVVLRLLDHDLSRRGQEIVRFQGIEGTIWMPDETPRAAVALVHGDGPQDRTSGDGYAPFINTLLDAGIAVLSWDKPGVAASEGNWLDQSMADRADETAGALDLLAGRFEGLPVGALGFSQAGWVLPQLTAEDADFIVLIGAAVSWQAQGAYYTETRLRAEGLEGAALEAALEEAQRGDATLFDRTATTSDLLSGLSADRWRFIRINRFSDARADLEQLDIPLFAIWGAEDLNVDPEANSAIYRDLVDHPDSQIIVWPDATHGLLDAQHYNWQLTEQWPQSTRLRFAWDGSAAYAPGVLAAITDWIIVRTVLDASVD